MLPSCFPCLRSPGSAFADVQLPGIISDHMLLQRDVPVRIFGKALPGEAVTVAYRGRTAQTVTDPLGRWEVWLQPLTPGPAAEMTITGANTMTIADVLVGDVWVGSGQLEMQWAVRQADNADAEIASAKFPQIRLFYVPRKPEFGSRRRRRCQVGCLLAGNYCRVLRGHGPLRPWQMHQDLKVPMGLIHSSWGGTPIASWIGGPSLVGDRRLEPFLT